MKNARARLLAALLGLTLWVPLRAGQRETPLSRGPAIPGRPRVAAQRTANFKIPVVTKPVASVGKLASGPARGSPEVPAAAGAEIWAKPESRAAARVFDRAGVGAVLKDWFGGLRQSVIPDPDVTEARAKRVLPALRAAHASTWKKRLAMLPEQSRGMSTEGALKLLTKLKGAEDPAAGASHVRNGTFFRSLGGGQTAVVKKNFKRSSMGEGKVYHVYNDVRCEVLAFILDRYLGTNLVPPTVALGEDTVAQLRVDAWPIGVGDASRAPPNLMDMSHLNLLDLLMKNPDREVHDMFAPDNLLADRRGKVVGIDFDLSRPAGFSLAESALHNLQVEGVILEPERRFWSRGDLPGVYSLGVLRRLKAMTSGTLASLSRRASLSLTREEVGGILSARGAILHSLEILKARYGGLIFLP